MHMRTIAVLGFMLMSLNACQFPHVSGGDHPRSDAVRSFVQQTLNLELRGMRWNELLDSNRPREFYQRFLWTPDVEPGWDVVTISDSVTVDSVTPFAARPWEELTSSGDVEKRVSTGYEVAVTFKNVYSFDREQYRSVQDEHLRLFVIDTARGFRITDRLHPPHLGLQAAAVVLRTAPYAATALDPLRSRIQPR